jgi:hypothetical protein
MIAQVPKTESQSLSAELPPACLRHDRGVVYFNRTDSEQRVYDLSLHKSAGGRQLLGQIELCSRRGWIINYLEREVFHESLDYTTFTEALEAVLSELDERQRLANRAKFAEA